MVNNDAYQRMQVAVKTHRGRDTCILRVLLGSGQHLGQNCTMMLHNRQAPQEQRSHQPSEICIDVGRYNVKKRTRRGSKGAKKRVYMPPTMEMAAEALAHYKRGNRWKAIFENIIRWRKVKLECRYEIQVSLADLDARIQAAPSLEEAAALEHDKQRIFGDDASADFYLHHYHRWTFNSEVRDFETHIYTNNVREGVDILYRRLFCIFTNYSGLSTCEDELFAIFTAYHNASWARRVDAYQKKPRLVEKSSSPPLSLEPQPPSPSIEPQPPAPSIEPQPPTTSLQPPAPDDQDDDPELEQMIRELQDEDRLQRSVHEMPSNSERLQLWGISDQSVDAYSLDGGPKRLVQWVSVNCLRMRVALDEAGAILFARCSLHWCWRRLHAWENVVSYRDTRPTRMLVTAPMEIVCPSCWPKLVNCLAFPGALPPEWSEEPLSSLQPLVTGLKWTVDTPTRE